ncbi:isopentenyl-diphosphate Delta-isomerase [Sediminitomix flava]|uniref:Isopentenyl-diphosphate delta-isomerase n=1 Tax=Sediminitomix flava TaxID=379075 RepID=A0A315Z5I1_SEDFL|nr:isopentenyl-diphosphate Delta-isomerase [Sediminitomix flava]PWJ38459.1 isopentenyl-diphosphate delta-isomerase [Sediminitomix flava]
MEQVILVNEKDEQIGLMEKLEAHEKGVLHRAFSIFIFNQKNQLLLQRRALEKYHSGGLWTNTCCSHPRNNESNLDAAIRRLDEEMGFTTPLEDCFSFIYKSDFENGLIEHELDHVFVGYYDKEPDINLEEVCEWKWLEPEKILEEIRENPEQFTTWFRICFEDVIHHLQNKIS